MQTDMRAAGDCTSSAQQSKKLFGRRYRPLRHAQPSSSMPKARVSQHVLDVKDCCNSFDLSHFGRMLYEIIDLEIRMILATCTVVIVVLVFVFILIAVVLFVLVVVLFAVVVVIVRRSSIPGAIPPPQSPYHPQGGLMYM
jgi:hypothetical protein